MFSREWSDFFKGVLILLGISWQGYFLENVSPKIQENNQGVGYRVEMVWFTIEQGCLVGMGNFSFSLFFLLLAVGMNSGGSSLE